MQIQIVEFRNKNEIILFEIEYKMPFTQDVIRHVC